MPAVTEVANPKTVAVISASVPIPAGAVGGGSWGLAGSGGHVEARVGSLDGAPVAEEEAGDLLLGRARDGGHLGK